jgi:hypothetical protein
VLINTTHGFPSYCPSILGGVGLTQGGRAPRRRDTGLRHPDLLLIVLATSGVMNGSLCPSVSCRACRKVRSVGSLAECSFATLSTDVSTTQPVLRTGSKDCHSPTCLLVCESVCGPPIGRAVSACVHVTEGPSLPTLPGVYLGPRWPRNRADRCVLTEVAARIIVFGLL